MSAAPNGPAGMIRRVEGQSSREVRTAYPTAAIIRHLIDGEFIVFGAAFDALGHGTGKAQA